MMVAITCLWDVTLCSLVRISWHFWWKYSIMRMCPTQHLFFWGVGDGTPTTALTWFGPGLLLYFPRSRCLHERFTYLITCRILNVVMKILKLLLKNHTQLYFHAG